MRKSSGRRVRQPLASLTVAAADAPTLEAFTSIMADELNVKQVNLSTDLAAVGSFTLQVVPAALGPRLGQNVQQVIKAVKTGDWSQDVVSGVVTAGGVELRDGEYSLRLIANDPDRSAALPASSGVVVLDTTLTPELEAEGVTRDLVRLVQQARRDADLHVSDRIALTLGVAESVRRQIVPFLSLLTDATLATSVSWSSGLLNAELDGEPIHIEVQRAEGQADELAG